MMIEIAGAAWVLPLTFALQGISAVLILTRLVRGPRATDRVVAIDALTMIGIGVIALLALAAAQPMLLDAAVVLALVSFLSTTAFILMFRRRGRGPDEAVAWPDERPAASAPAALDPRPLEDQP
ncbi:monovalent cation/H+ antiporter complex subunit F [Thauera sp.]|jgi:multicomponent Na+:H+ antiporter subunit F|uniref:monovalent cation/H+ antiporter complex subunit F n=1 Tax=Thauera sp. TaxID=1905334 RepID=UPI002A360F3C|nr:monovalent cation/H+ antiporter complex subunit F [Thauera sp.]MDX9886761.1 monovalent cation/H+ antiporter complex subunit F [Thauera sp.]